MASNDVGVLGLSWTGAIGMGAAVAGTEAALLFAHVLDQRGSYVVCAATLVVAAMGLWAAARAGVSWRSMLGSVRQNPAEWLGLVAMMFVFCLTVVALV